VSCSVGYEDRGQLCLCAFANCLDVTVIGFTGLIHPFQRNGKTHWECYGVPLAKAPASTPVRRASWGTVKASYR
jgi:hypothetical protein